MKHAMIYFYYKLTVIYHWPILRKNVSVVKWFACSPPVR